MEGTSGTMFSPNMDTTRAMIVTLLWRLENSPASTGWAEFPDVSQGQWYSDAVRWAVSAGVVKGYGDGSFGPEDTITREQLAAMLYRYAKADAPVGDLTAFSDSDHISDWAEEAVRWAVGQGIITGKNGGYLDPKGRATRAETAAMFARYSRWKNKRLAQDGAA